MPLAVDERFDLAGSLLRSFTMQTLDVRHVTTYRYAQPVTFGEHRLMLRPRDSHDLRLLRTSLVTTPPATIRWIHDTFGNSIAIASFADASDTLTIESVVRIEHYPSHATEIVIDEAAIEYPFDYDADDAIDLASALLTDRHGPEGVVDAWAKSFLREDGRRDTKELLLAMNAAIKATFTYRPRDEEGTQTAAETLAIRTGSCRDFAMLLVEGARRLGIAARFVSGYLYDDANVDVARVGLGSTHAWGEVFVPGAGWIELDPTNDLVAGKNLIRVAVARSPTQAAPISGSFTGAENDYLGMTVDVSIERVVPPIEAECTGSDEMDASNSEAPVPDTDAAA